MPYPRRGDTVHVDHRKWDGSEHWQTCGLYLGADRFGHWVGAPTGTAVHRPHHRFDLTSPEVKLHPTQPWTAAFFDREDPTSVQVYVDIATEPQWHLTESPVRVSLTDLDLDVVRAGERVHLDDEDEFAEHQVRYGYPADVVARAEQAAADVLTAVTDRTGPFDASVSARWLDVLHELSDR